MRRMLPGSSKCAPQPPRAKAAARRGAVSRNVAVIASGMALI